jgi:outer membrane receptor for ferrienterochelin and colicins
MRRLQPVPSTAQRELTMFTPKDALPMFSKVLVLMAACLLAGVASIPAQQSGEIRGTVQAAQTGQPVPGAVVEVVTVAGQVARRTVTENDGSFVVSGVSPGTYVVQATITGYATQRASNVSVQPGQPISLTFTMTPMAVELDPVVISASRRTEKALSAPAHVEVVTPRLVEERPAVTASDHVRGLPGVDIAQTGMITSSVVTRGFNNVFSGALLMITDNRIASVPSLRVNAPYMIPASNEDISRIEVLLGPASALYGPNSSNGVMHIITRSPFESAGTTVSVAGGERSVFQGAVRHAGVATENIGYKVSGQYFRGNDWRYVDPAEEEARDRAEPSDPNTRIGLRDYTTENFKVDGRVDMRPAQNMEVILSSGMNQVGNAIEMTGIGAAQARDWRYSYLQGRFRWDRLFAQAFGNFSDAGDTYLLRTGEPVVDRSRLYVAQVQHGLDLLEGRQNFTYGLDYQLTQPRTAGTVVGRNEGKEIREVGVYLQSETRLLSNFDFIASGRLDSHNYVRETVLSPRAAVVFRPTESQTLRLTYNRAFDTPTSNNIFLDIEAARLSPFLSVRAIGVPNDGFAFRRDCPGGAGNLCMRTGLNPGAGYIPANAALLWPAVVQIMLQQEVDLRGLPAPAPTEVGTTLRLFNTTTQLFIDANPADVLDIAPLEPTISNTWELGYRGLLLDRLLLSGALFHTRKDNFVGPLLVETPSVFFDRASLQTYLARFMPATNAAQIAAGIAGLSGGTGAAASPRGIPLGTVVPDHELTASGDMFLTYRNFGQVELWGTDLVLQVLLTERVSLSGNYSYASENYFTAEEVGGLSPLALNSPKNKGSVTGRYESPGMAGFAGELRVRYTDGFPQNSGVYIGTVESYTHLDATVNYRFGVGTGALLTPTAQNLLNDRTRQFVGAPAIGRMIMARVQYTL